MGMGNDGFPWVSWDSRWNGNKNVAVNGDGMGMGSSVAGMEVIFVSYIDTRVS